jgi:hypothetical protein
MGIWNVVGRALTRQDSALTSEWPRVVRDGALHGGATIGTNREGHGGLAGRRIIGGGDNQTAR